ncbi:MAG: ABC transporter substrate-binding protein, partial [Streptosporangiaceae bacterium]
AGHMRTGRIRGTALLVTAVALAVAACGSSIPGVSTAAGSGTGSAGVEKPDLKVAVVPALDSAGFFIALYGGLFRDAGLNVQFIPVTSSETAIADQENGTYDITGGNYVSYIQAQAANQANLDIFAEGSVMEPGDQALYTMPGSPIKSLEDLEGRTVGINAPNNILYLLVASVLAEHGIPVSKVHFRDNIPLPEMADALASGEISAAVLPEPFASDAELSYGAVPLTDLDQGATASFPVQGYVVTKQWAQEYPRTLAAFYKALEEGQQLADTNRSDVEKAMEAMPAPLGLTHQTAAVLALDEYPVSSGPAGSVDTIRLQRVVDVMQQFLGFSSSFNVESMLMAGN